MIPKLAIYATWYWQVYEMIEKWSSEPYSIQEFGIVAFWED